ncbi:MAG: sigma-70 family RNA polymerase sigma factor [Planctomycetes bacterium]|nr:sigma-70 family RNA polymerase sigma factor [Planctomycetota bacterium]
MSEHEPSSVFRTVTHTSLLNGLKDPGNRSVWQDFVARYRPMIVKFAQRRGLSEEDAQDAAQQTLIAFCGAYQQGKYERQQGRLRFWLFGIARNQIRNARKRDRHREVQAVEDSGATAFFDRLPDEADMEQQWEEEWQQAVLRQCLEEIRREFDPRSLEAFERFAWKGQPAQEVARQLGMTPNAVFIAKHRIMKRIKELLPVMEDIF